MNSPFKDKLVPKNVFGLAQPDPKHKLFSYVSRFTVVACLSILILHENMFKYF